MQASGRASFFDNPVGLRHLQQNQAQARTSFEQASHSPERGAMRRVRNPSPCLALLGGASVPAGVREDTHQCRLDKGGETA